MADDLVQKWERSKQRYEQSGTTQSDEFWKWIRQMNSHEVATRKNERVYLVISKLRRIAEGERRKVGSGGLDALRSSMPSSSMRSSASIRSASKRKDRSRRDRSRPDSDDSRDDLSSSSEDEDNETTNFKKQFNKALAVGAKMVVSALSTHNSDASESTSDDSSRSLKRKSSSLDRGRNEKRPRYVPRYPSPPGILPHTAFLPSPRVSEADARSGGRGSVSRSRVRHSTSARSRSRSPYRADSPMEGGIPRPGSRPRKPEKPNPPPQSHFQGSKTSEQHWAVEVGGRYFELQVCKKLYGDGVKSFSQFTCLHQVGQEDREITEKIYVGRTHMSHRVLKEIGVGIMKTQPKYTLPSDNCQHFMAVYLPRILCERHPHLTTLPNASVEWVYKFTALPTYAVGIKDGLVTEVEHHYFRIASGVHQLLDRWKSNKAVAKKTFESREMSSYRFTLQGNDPRQYESCRTIRKNPYLIIHREFSKSERRPLGDSEERANYSWLWEPNRKVRRTAQLQELEMEQSIEAAKGIWKGLRKRKMDIEHEARLRMKWEQGREDVEQRAKERRISTNGI